MSLIHLYLTTTPPRLLLSFHIKIFFLISKHHKKKRDDEIPMQLGEDEELTVYNRNKSNRKQLLIIQFSEIKS